MIGLKGGKSAGDVAAEIAMSRLNWPGAFLMVEGASDSKFWRSRKHDECDVILAIGRDQVLNAAKLVATAGLKGVLGVVDDDFDCMSKRPRGAVNVLSTEPRDLEGMLLRSRALDKALAEYADPESLNAFLNVEHLRFATPCLDAQEFSAKYD